MARLIDADELKKMLELASTEGVAGIKSEAARNLIRNIMGGIIEFIDSVPTAKET